MKVETPQILWHAEEKNLPAALLSLDVQGDILATAGQGIHLWRLNNHQPPANDGPNSASAPATNPKSSSAAVAISPPPRATFITALKCHDRPVNRIAFHGRYLASAGDAGDIVIFYPLCRKWVDVQHENDVRYINAGRSGEAVTDLCWSGDGRRLVVGTIDHGVVVVERQDASPSAAGGGGDDSNVSFRIVFRCHHWHAHYVQGVAYDPLNLYIGTASSDRTVKIAVARTVKKQFQLLAPPASSSTTTSSFGGGGNKTGARPVHGGRFVDEGSLKSFCRRLAWTPDGGYLIVPAAHHEVHADDETSSSYATLLYARHRFDEPARILGGLDKVRYAARPACGTPKSYDFVGTHRFILLFFFFSVFEPLSSTNDKQTTQHSHDNSLPFVSGPTPSFFKSLTIAKKMVRCHTVVSLPY
jgi:WD40 repeat protein